MKNIMKLFLIFFLVYLIAGCQKKDETIDIFTDTGGTDVDIKISVTKGDYWYEIFKTGIMRIKITPQIAVWTEDLNGNFLNTIYVTKKFAKQDWRSRDGYDPDKVFRVESLPVWYYRSRFYPTKNNPLPDSLTSASPETSFNLMTVLDSAHEDIYVFLEINNSYDYSDESKKDIEGYNGQPAVVYRTKVDLNKKGSYVMTVLGHSEHEGMTGNINSVLTAVPTAINIISECNVIVE